MAEGDGNSALSSLLVTVVVCATNGQLGQRAVAGRATAGPGPAHGAALCPRHPQVVPKAGQGKGRTGFASKDDLRPRVGRRRLRKRRRPRALTRARPPVVSPQPKWTIPTPLFGPVWGALYCLMGVAAKRVYEVRCWGTTRALRASCKPPCLVEQNAPPWRAERRRVAADGPVRGAAGPESGLAAAVLPREELRVGKGRHAW